MKHTNIQNCSQCNSPLILISKITEKIEGFRYPQSNSTYRCSNKECQDDKDIETAKRIQIREIRLVEAQKRIDKNNDQKKKIELANLEN